jgi:UDP-N-acetylmuramoyl-tripeptide--D-alanyl-D-alanine ligase
VQGVIRGNLTEVARTLSATLVGPDSGFHGISTDSRTLRARELFVALRGPHFDGHAYAIDALRRGAAGAVVERPLKDPLGESLESTPEGPLTWLRVPDSLAALGALAAEWRSRFDLPVMAVTGSYGKTTVKEMMAAIAASRGEVLATRGNLNNEIGLPLTLFGLDAGHRAAVLELGANHAGEIGRLTAICRPAVGVVTAAGPVHLEGFGSVEGVARAKGELFAGLPEDGVAVINLDDEFAPLWREMTGARRSIGFGSAPDAQFCAEQIRQSLDDRGPLLEFRLLTPDGTAMACLRLPGRHNVTNALAAAAATWVLGWSLDEIVAGLAQVAGVRGRMSLRRARNGALVIDDTYNANPDALRAAIEYATTLPGACWLVLGDMGELGPATAELHAAAGQLARESGIARLYTYGPESAAAATAYGEGRHFTDLAALAAVLEEELPGDVNLLVKGSRSMRLEKLIERLVGTEEG